MLFQHATFGHVYTTFADIRRHNILLEEYRSRVLPEVTNSWHLLNSDQKKACTKLNSFFCGLHLLVAFAEVSEKCLTEFENAILPHEFDTDTEQSTKSAESRTVHLIRASSKCLSRGGDERSGCYAEFQTYLKSKVKRVRFMRFHGNRFNIIFLMAEMVYFHHLDIIEFFETQHLPSNKLQKAVLWGTKQDLLIACCKVLGLISKLVTAPLWRILESGTHILDMNAHYLKLLEFFEIMSTDASDFVRGNDSPFDDEYINSDDTYTCLLESNDKVDALCLQVSQVLFKALHALMEKMLPEHLPGGKYFDVGEEVRNQTKSVIPHNKLPEFAFGVLDFQLSRGIGQMLQHYLMKLF